MASSTARPELSWTGWIEGPALGGRTIRVRVHIDNLDAAPGERVITILDVEDVTNYEETL